MFNAMHIITALRCVQQPATEPKPQDSLNSLVLAVSFFLIEFPGPGSIVLRDD